MKSDQKLKATLSIDRTPCPRRNHVSCWFPVLGLWGDPALDSTPPSLFPSLAPASLRAPDLTKGPGHAYPLTWFSSTVPWLLRVIGPISPPPSPAPGSETNWWAFSPAPTCFPPWLYAALLLLCGNHNWPTKITCRTKNPQCSRAEQ